MNENNYIITPQNLLDVVEEVAMGMPHMDKRYLIEYDKPKVVGDNLKDGIKISIDDFVATPIRAFKWDYLVGNVPDGREFVITDNKEIGYLIHVFNVTQYTPQSEKEDVLFSFDIYKVNKNDYPIDKNGIDRNLLEMKLELAVYPMKKEIDINKINVNEKDVEDDFPRRIYELLSNRYILKTSS